MSQPIYNDHGKLVTAEGKTFGYITSAFDVRRFKYPTYVPPCPECKGSGEADRSMWDWLFGAYPLCEVCKGERTLRRPPAPPPPPPNKHCKHCGCAT